MADDTDPLAAARESVAKAIADLRAFSAPAGSTVMRQAQNALDYMGYAYSCLRPDSSTNPAWSDD